MAIQPAGPAMPGLTVDQYLDDWLALQRTQLHRSSLHSYTALIDRYVRPALGALELDAVSPSVLNTFYVELLLHGGQDGASLSLRTVSYCHSILRKALGDAVRVGVLAENPCLRATVPRLHPERPVKDRRDTPMWSAEQLVAFFAATADHPLHDLWVVLAGTGIRRGEALALSWEDLDFDARVLRVRYALSVVRQRIERKPPKNSRRRSVGFDARVAEALRRQGERQAELRERHGPLWNNPWNLVFTRDDGRPHLPDVISRAFRRRVDRTDLPRISVHSLRHLHATLCLQAGIPIKVVQQRLGHATARITLETYSHVLPAMEAAAVDAFAALLDDAEQP